jgi:4-alpha-glucanotransferase
MPLIITPVWLGLPERIGQHRAWGLATPRCTASARSSSWGVGDLTDLEDLAVWSRRRTPGGLRADQSAACRRADSADAAVALPAEQPPLANPLYLRLERIPEYAVTSPQHRDEIEKINVELLTQIADSTQIDRDRSWTAKREASRSSFRCLVRRDGKPPSRRIGAVRAAVWRGSLPGRRSLSNMGPLFAEWPIEFRIQNLP